MLHEDFNLWVGLKTADLKNWLVDLVDFRINFALFTNLHNPHCFGKNNLVFIYI